MGSTHRYKKQEFWLNHLIGLGFQHFEPDIEEIQSYQYPVTLKQASFWNPVYGGRICWFKKEGVVIKIGFNSKFELPEFPVFGFFCASERLFKRFEESDDFMLFLEACANFSLLPLCVTLSWATSWVDYLLRKKILIIC